MWVLDVVAHYQDPKPQNISFHVVLQKTAVKEGIKERVGSAPRSGDKFHILDVTPKVCSAEELLGGSDLHEAGSEVQAALLQTQRSKGYIKPDPKTVNWNTVLLSEETVAALKGTSVDWSQVHAGSKAYGAAKLDIRGTPRAVSAMYNQGSCGSCYAWAAMTAFSYRMLIATNGRYDIFTSPQSAMSCTDCDGTPCGCGGGDSGDVWKAMEAQGGFTPLWCNEYNFKAPKVTECSAHCGTSLKYTVKTGTISTSSAAKDSLGSPSAVAAAMMHELYMYGPVAGNLMVCSTPRVSLPPSLPRSSCSHCSFWQCVCTEDCDLCACRPLMSSRT